MRHMQIIQNSPFTKKKREFELTPFYMREEYLVTPYELILSWFTTIGAYQRKPTNAPTQ